MSYHSNIKHFLLKAQCGIPGQKKDEWITLKRYNYDTADMFLSPFANIYQTKVNYPCWV